MAKRAHHHRHGRMVAKHRPCAIVFLFRVNGFAQTRCMESRCCTADAFETTTRLKDCLCQCYDPTLVAGKVNFNPGHWILPQNRVQAVAVGSSASMPTRKRGRKTWTCWYKKWPRTVVSESAIGCLTTHSAGSWRRPCPGEIETETKKKSETRNARSVY